MDKKTFTFLVTSNRRGKTQSYTISSGWLKTLFSFGLVVIVIVVAMVVDYLGLLLQEGETKRLRAENIQLTKQFEVVENKVHSLEGSLDRLKSMTTKIKLITNIDSEERALRLSMGKLPKPGQPVASQDVIGNESGHSDYDDRLEGEVFHKPSVPNIRKNELARLRNKNYAILSVRAEQALKESKLVEQGVIQLQQVLSEKQSLLDATPNMKPVKGWVAANFGYRIDRLTGRPNLNNGIDLAASAGTPVYAPANGKVALVTYDPQFGKVVELDHSYGVKTKYAHNSQVFVEVGQIVQRGDVIAAVGNTGRTPVAMLHYEVRVHGVPVDPMNYILSE